MLNKTNESNMFNIVYPLTAYGTFYKKKPKANSTKPIQFVSNSQAVHMFSAVCYSSVHLTFKETLREHGKLNKPP